MSKNREVKSRDKHAKMFKKSQHSDSDDEEHSSKTKDTYRKRMRSVEKGEQRSRYMKSTCCVQPDSDVIQSKKEEPEKDASDDELNELRKQIKISRMLLESREKEQNAADTSSHFPKLSPRIDERLSSLKQRSALKAEQVALDSTIRDVLFVLDRCWRYGEKVTAECDRLRKLLMQLKQRGSLGTIERQSEFLDGLDSFLQTNGFGSSRPKHISTPRRDVDQQSDGSNRTMMSSLNAPTDRFSMQGNERLNRTTCIPTIQINGRDVSGSTLNTKPYENYGLNSFSAKRVDDMPDITNMDEFENLSNMGSCKRSITFKENEDYPIGESLLQIYANSSERKTCPFKSRSPKIEDAYSRSYQPACTTNRDCLVRDKTSYQPSSTTNRDCVLGDVTCLNPHSQSPPSTSVKKNIAASETSEVSDKSFVTLNQENVNEMLEMLLKMLKSSTTENAKQVSIASKDPAAENLVQQRSTQIQAQILSEKSRDQSTQSDVQDSTTTSSDQPVDSADNDFWAGNEKRSSRITLTSKAPQSRQKVNTTHLPQAANTPLSTQTPNTPGSRKPPDIKITSPSQRSIQSGAFSTTASLPSDLFFRWPVYSKYS